MIMIREDTFKIMFVGELDVGKTSAIKRFVDGTFMANLKSTIGVDFSFKRISVEVNHPEQEQKTAALQIWDVAGEKRFRDILPFYISGMKGVILTFDSTSLLTLVSLHDWLDLIGKYINLKTIPLILISTKHDLKLNISDKEIYQFMKKYNIGYYYQTSSVTGKNIEAVFEKVTQLMIHGTPQIPSDEYKLLENS
ncbi:MAG: hypothetical protein HeimC3_36810 [Candidatus Heimdallarchaeota archaeon LC_3]|nr:MAG: hypothetical protein HeimC3_36810 [Candidatus Heimdallarchaeota archaeon LC_3]